MATDPFGDIKRPICDEFVEIGQSTFVELISATNCTTSPAIGRSAPNVSEALRQLAFGKVCTDKLRSLSPGPTAVMFSAVDQDGGSQAAGFSSYDIRKKSTGVKGSAYKKKVQNLGAAKSSTEFKKLVTNVFAADVRAFDVLPGCPGDCPDPCSEPGEDDVCAVDFCICLDVTGSMGNAIASVKTGIQDVVDLLKSTIGNNFRLALVLFSDSDGGLHNNADTELFFDDKCGDASFAAFQTKIEPVVRCYQAGVADCSKYGGGDQEEASAYAVKFAAEGGAGCWREGNVIRAIVLITDAPNKPSLGTTVTEAANAAALCNIKVAYAGLGGAAFAIETLPDGRKVNEGAIYRDITGGVYARLVDRDGTKLISLLQTFIFSLCAEFIPAPECEGGTNLVLNGTFEDNINSWNVGGTVVWDGDFESPVEADPVLRSARLDKGASIQQVFTGLEPGDLVIMNYNWCLRSDIGDMALAASAPPLPSMSGKLITPFIVNPGEDPETGFPAVGKLGPAPIRRPGDDGATVYDCTCTLIAPRFVLTAAHCVDSGYADNAMRVDFNGTVYSSVKIYIHPLWNEALINTDAAYDIAIIELDTDVVGIDPLGISSFSGAPGTGPEPGIGDPIKIVGFGLTGDDLGLTPGSFGAKRSADQMVDEVTTQLIRYFFDVSGEGAAGPGDSGGPVLFEDGGNWYISALVSGGSHPGGLSEIGKLGTTIFNTRVSAFDGWIVGTLSGETQSIIGELRDSSDDPIDILDGSGSTSYEAVAGDCSTGRETRPPIKVRVPLDGVVKVYFELEGVAAPNTHWLYLDQIIVCNLSNTDCGPGSRNLVRNGNFESGVSEWTDKNGIALPTTDPSVWDSNIFTIIVNLTAKSEVRQRLSGLVPAKILILSFEVTSYEPDIISELELVYGVLSNSGIIIESRTITNATLQPTPQIISVQFSVPVDGIVEIFFKTGAVGGVCKIRNVLVCDFSGVCEVGYTRVSYDQFETDKGSWSGGIYDLIGKQVLLNDSSDIASRITQTFTDLEPGSIFQLSVDVKDVGGVVITLQPVGDGISDPTITQLITPVSPGYYTATIVVQESGIIVASIRIRDSDVTVNIDDILTCVSLPEPCDGSISGVQVLIEWDGIVRSPVNLFHAIIRYTIRNPSDPFDITEVTFLATSEGRLSITACDLWKSQIASGNFLGNGLTNIGNIDEGDSESIATKGDWLWAIPKNNSSGVQDNMMINFSDPGPGNLVENVRILLLLNNIIPTTGTNTPPVYPAPLGCDTDPAIEFNVILRFINSNGLNREFSAPIAKSDLLVQEADFSIGSSWDTDSATGNGIKGSSARWEAIGFDLDTVDGRGLDQCTIPLSYRGEATGDLLFKKFQLEGIGTFFDPCQSEVIVEDISSSESGNETQSIILPGPTGGRWDLSFTRFGITDTTTLAWNTTAAQIENRLGAFSNIGGISNVNVTGSGIEEDPFIVEFVNDLGSINLNLLVADGNALTGASVAFATTEVDGTPNERKTISNPSDRNFPGQSRQNLIVSFDGDSSVPIPYGASLNEMTSSLEGMDSIGTGNILITGNITNRDVFYSGPYRLEFINDLGDQNVPTMAVQPAHYQIVTDWNGGIGGGKNEEQHVNITATDGTFTIRIFNDDSSEFADTAPINFNADAAAVKSAIITAASFIIDTDIVVNVLEQDPLIGLTIWEIIFRGAYIRTNMPQVQINGSNLVGAPIIVEETRAGFGSHDRQQLTIVRANAGSFRLTVTIAGIDYTTTNITWNTTAAGIQAQLIALPPFVDGDIIVSDRPKTNSEQSLRVVVMFNRKFGNVPLMVPDFQGILLCDPIVLPPVDPGPYPYPIPDCDEIDDLSCQSGPLLCRPGEGGEFEELDPCCDEDTIPDRTNISTRIKLERDLFDPRTKRTIRELALLKCLKPSNYIPYVRNFNNGTITETSYDMIVSTKMSILLVENELDTTNGRRRILNHIASHREILPARFVWPDLTPSQPGV